MLNTAEHTLEHQVQTMFHSMIASWAVDTLRLRRAGLDRPIKRGTRTAAIAPGSATSHWSEPDYPANLAIQWRPGTNHRRGDRFGAL